MTRGLRHLVSLIAIGSIAACSGSPSRSLPPPTTAGGPGAVPTVAATTMDPWTADLDQLDAMVRAHHASPFTIHSEAEWTARLAAIRPKLAAASPDEQFALVASLVGLLDTHTTIKPGGDFHAYEVFTYKFSDGWFVIAAKDKSLVGSRLVSIGGHPIAEVEATLRPLVPHDNEDGFLLNGALALSYVEFLHGTGIVADPAKPQYVLERRDGSQTTVDFAALSEPSWEQELGLTGYLVGSAPEAVARHTELVWARLDAKDKVFYISVNDYGDTTAAVAALRAALDAGTANRVVLDIRYLPGGNGDFQILTALEHEPRVNRVGGLTVLISRLNESAATQVALEFDTHTAVLLVGEPPPARADNFRCACFEIVLANSGIVVSVPTVFDNIGDTRSEIQPDVPMSVSSADFFAGRDPVLDAALKGLTAP